MVYLVGMIATTASYYASIVIQLIVVSRIAFANTTLLSAQFAITTLLILLTLPQYARV